MHQRVLCVTGERRVCEPTRYLARLVRGLRGLGHDVECFLPEGAGAVTEAVGGREWWGLGTLLASMLFRGEWVRAAGEFEPTLVHACGWRAARVGRLLAHTLNLPLVESVFERPGWLRLKGLIGAGDGAAGRPPTCLVASHERLAEGLRGRLWGRRADVRVLPPGVLATPPEAGAGARQSLDGVPVRPDGGGRARDLSRPGAGHRELVERPEAAAEGAPPVVIGTVAELDGSADVELLLRALRLLQDEGVHAECAVVGEGPQEHRLRRLAHGLGLRRETHFLTPLLDPQPILAETAVVVLLPTRRGRRQLPVLSILEAQAAGRAVISARVPGIEQFVEEGVTGRLLPKATPPVLASLIKELLLDPEARRRLGEEARRRALGSASLASILEATVLLYDSLTAPHPPASGGQSR